MEFCDAWKALNPFSGGYAPDLNGEAHDAPPDFVVGWSVSARLWRFGRRRIRRHPFPTQPSSQPCLLDAPVSNCPFSEPRMPSDRTFTTDTSQRDAFCDAWKALKSGPTKSRPEPSGTVRSRPEPSGHRPDAARSRPDAARSRPDIVRRPTPPGAVQRPPHQTGKCPRIRLQLGR